MDITFMMRRLFLIGLLLPRLIFGVETQCRSSIEKKYCLLRNNPDSGLACEIFSRSSADGYSEKTSLWRARFQVEYCDAIYEEFLKDLQAKGWKCEEPIDDDTDTCSKGETPKTLSESSQDEVRSPSSEGALSQTEVPISDEKPNKTLELGVDFSNDLLVARSNGTGEFASRWAYPSMYARFLYGIGETVNAFADGWIHYVEYTSSTTDALIDTKQWNWRIGLGMSYRMSPFFRPELSVGLNRHPFIAPAQSNEIVFEGMVTPEIGAAVNVGSYEIGFGSLAGKIGAYYLFSKAGTRVEANSGYTVRMGLDLQRQIFSLPCTTGIRVDRIVQNTNHASQSSWLLGVLFGATFGS